MRKYFYILFLLIFILIQGWAQEACPGCLIAIPDDLAEDTAWLALAPDARAGVYYEADVSFRLPKTTTPVADEQTPPGLTISKITINNVVNMPPGLNWEANQLEFNPADTTDGCVRICGVPLQPGFYQVEVVLTARVLVSNSTTSFSFPILVRQSVTETDGFSMINNSGCGDLEVSFENKIPSEGRTGFSYLWDFGNGNYSVAENPVNQRYDRPGVYTVNYQAVVDTAGYKLSRVVVNEVACDDTFNRPDLQIEIFDAEDGIVFRSEEFPNVIPPLTLDLDIPLDDGNYFIQIIDKDSGIDGGDDNCGAVNFNRYTNGKLFDNDMSVTINTTHPVDTLRAVDTVFVFAQPDPPLIKADIPDVLCQGDSLLLMTDYTENVQWFQDSLPLLEGDTSFLKIGETAPYWVQYTSPDGCIAVSRQMIFAFPDPPEFPVFTNTGNQLTVFDPAALPRFAQLQWFLDGQPIEGANQTTYCIGESGEYRLTVDDWETGCSNSYSRTITYNPDFPNCVSSTADPLAALLQDFRLFPNPNPGRLWLEWRREDRHDVQLRIRNSQGQLLREENWLDLWGEVRRSLDISSFPEGLYFVEMEMDGRKGNYRVVKVDY